MGRFISVVIKPTLACNVECRHCYHSPEELHSSGRISFSRLERLFSLLSKEYDSVWFIWHGGEPLVMGLPFYKKVMELEKKYFGFNRYGNTIQTNGLEIDRKFLNFCRDNEINIGISNEGPYNSVLRKGTDGVEKEIVKMAEKERVFAVGATISAETQDKQLEIYRHFRDIGTAVSMIPVIPAGCTACRRELVPDAGVYVRNAIETFEDWLCDPEVRVPLTPQYLYVLSALGNPQPSDCAHSSCLGKWICMYPDGDLYPCAKPCPASMKLGNIDSINTIGDAFRSPGFVEILKGSIERRNKCQSCEIFDFCQGGCSIDALCECGLENNGGDSCHIYKELFTYIRNRVEGIVQNKEDLSKYNAYVRDAILGKLVNPALGTF